MPTHAELEQFRLQTRDLYIPAGDIGMWQGALRNPDDPLRATIGDVIDGRERFFVELLYTDQVGSQRTITRFGVFPIGDSWMATVTRHWYLDWDGPRPDRDVRAASEVVLRDQEAAERQAAAQREMAAPVGVDGAPAQVGVVSEEERADASESLSGDAPRDRT